MSFSRGLGVVRRAIQIEVPQRSLFTFLRNQQQKKEAASNINLFYSTFRNDRSICRSTVESSNHLFVLFVVRAQIYSRAECLLSWRNWRGIRTINPVLFSSSLEYSWWYLCDEPSWSYSNCGWKRCGRERVVLIFFCIDVTERNVLTQL